MTADGDLHPPDHPEFVYDEFGYFHENCEEYGIELGATPDVRRNQWSVEPVGHLSGLHWTLSHPEVVFLHGGAQNAHTWDTVALALDRPALAIDLPGHGHSGHREDGLYDPLRNAEAVISALDAHLSTPVVLVGMSLGGLTANAVAAQRPDLVEALVIVDITPGVNSDKARDIHAFIAGPQSFASFSEIFDRTVEFNPTRTHASLRRGILHNAHRVEDGSWEWNYDRRRLTVEDMPSMDDLWEDVSSVTAPYLLVRGGVSPVVDDADVAELRRRQPDAVVEVVADAGHSVQGDDPLRLAALIAERLR